MNNFGEIQICGLTVVSLFCFQICYLSSFDFHNFFPLLSDSFALVRYGDMIFFEFGALRLQAKVWWSCLQHSSLHRS